MAKSSFNPDKYLNLNNGKNKEKVPVCDAPGCDKPGVCKAPKNNKLKEYYYFCESHAAEYNKNWNYYQGMNSTEIEAENKKDIYRRNPTSQFGIKGFTKEHVLNGSIDIDDKHSIFKNFFKSSTKSSQYENSNKSYIISEKIDNAMKLMDIGYPFSKSDLQKQYKKMVKIYHPDANANAGKKEKKQKEDIFKKTVEAYHILQDYLKNQS